MDPYHYESIHDPLGFPIIQQQPYHLHPTAGLGEGRIMRGGGRRRPGAKLSTDPQSVAARERRHRISDRFRVLRSLVPGGSKMDTVSMLEQAIHYVKFLKAQVTLHQAALVQHEGGSCHDFAAAYASSADAEVAAVCEQNHHRRGSAAGDGESSLTMLEIPAGPAQKAGVSYGDDVVAAHQLQLQALDPAVMQQLMMLSCAQELPPLPCCVFVQESSTTAPACYPVGNVHGDEADVHGSY
ncbi:hypothetical protein GUJ93_ZPchr0007g4167 [Zizania palustris]|uniref:BHLH domain-containing protein n=1 Tax=Zizania palustris TaxID=103762 RepID=A0A8J5W5L9_ZIZPA|nr:hypothetical protein GUJ93_ZPchr0007g4167 [Zizania palustris]